jgi:ketosteroid isomerase-like protein
VETDAEAAIRALVEERSVADVLVRYFRGIDAADLELAVSEFAEDAVAEVMTGKVVEGRDRIGRALGRILVRYERTSHHVTNVLVDLDGDRAVCSAYVYTYHRYAYHRMQGTGTTWHLWARIREDLRREGGRWVVAAHRLYGVDSVPAREDIPADWYVHPTDIPGERTVGRRDGGRP